MPKPRHDLTREQVLEQLAYDPATGIFTRTSTRGLSDRWKKGQSAGSPVKGAYVQIWLLGRLYQAHRLAWLVNYGVWPSKHIDHINGNRHDNRIANLRESDDLLNMQNIRKPHKDNKLGVLGVKLYNGRYVARIYVQGKERSLGSYDTAEEAHQAYLKAKRAMHEGCTI
ncbi:HNH endonuclease [Delftia acidovorans]|uniref:HNH endonuclease n=1 Tax=Delftia acidovorans TaxID=80866 RepID=UPI002FDCC250